MTEDPGPTPATVSSPDLLRAVRVTRALQGLLEAALWVVVGGSVLPFAALHRRGLTFLWVACLGAAAIAIARAVAVGGLRQRLGPQRAALHASGRWVVVDPHPADRALGFSIDLGEPAFPRGPLVLPGLALLAILLLPLVPRSGAPASPASEATRHGVTFVAALLLLHVAAGAAFGHRPARRRFLEALAWVAAVLALPTLLRAAGGPSFGLPVSGDAFAQDDCLRPLAETGVPGLLIGLWAGLAALAAARRDPWLFAALAGGLTLAFLGFARQIPVFAALFVVLAALGGGAAGPRSILGDRGGGRAPAPDTARRPS